MEHNELQRRRGGIRATIALAFGLLVCGCSSDVLSGRSSAPASPAASSPTLGDRLSNLFGKRTTVQTQPTAPGQTAIPADDIECPTVEIRAGTSTFAVSSVGLDPSPLSLRYQASFGQTARECKLVGNTLTMRVGVEGRVILGPAGGPGQVDVPVRYAVVREGPDPKTIVTKVHWQSINIAPGETNVPFTQIVEDLSFPMPRGNEIEAYVVYIGFDSAAVKEPAKKPPAKKPPSSRRAT